MSLLSKLERLEKVASRKTAKPIEIDPELVAFASRLFREGAERAARPKPPIHEQIMELRTELQKRIKDNESRDPAEVEAMRDLFGDKWNWLSEWVTENKKKELAELEALAATLS